MYLIPHGIFEITATVFQSAAGIMLFMFIWRFVKAYRSSKTHSVADSFDMSNEILIQSIVLMIFSTILLVIAAVLEAHFSNGFADFMMGLIFG